MRIVTGSGRLTISDNPYPTWAFASVFVLVGAFALGMGVIAAPDVVTTVLVGVIGGGNVVLGLLMIKREPGSVVELNRNTDRVEIRRWSVFGSTTSSYPLRALLGADLESRDPSEGGTVYRPRLRFAPPVNVPISMFWYQREKESQEVVAQVERFASERG